jgi:hypothetical protein
MEEECTSILLNNTYTTITSWDSRQLHVTAVGSKWVYKTKHNPDCTIRYKALLLITGCEQIDFSETYAPFRNLSTVRYLISLVGKHGWNIDGLQVVTAFFNPVVDDNDTYMTLPEGWPEGLNTPTITV